MALDSEPFRVHLKLILKANLGLLKATLSEIIKKPEQALWNANVIFSTSLINTKISLIFLFRLSFKSLVL